MKAPHLSRMPRRWLGMSAALAIVAASSVGFAQNAIASSEAFDWNWEYSVPSCTSLVVDYPDDLPTGQANDVNVRVKNIDTGVEVTLNFHNNNGTWAGTHVFDFTSHPNWPNWQQYAITWTQVGGTNYHWQGELRCGWFEPPVDPTPAPTPSEAVTPTPEPSETVTPTPEPSETATVTPTPTPSQTAEPTPEPSTMAPVSTPTVPTNTTTPSPAKPSASKPTSTTATVQPSVTTSAPHLAKTGASGTTVALAIAGGILMLAGIVLTVLRNRL